MKQSHKTLLLWVLLILMFLAIWHVLQPADKSKAAAFSEFVTDVHKGNVEEVKIKDHEYSYRVRTDGKNTVQKEAVGPMADQALLDSLKPDNKDTPGPKIVFDKEDSSPAWSSTLLALLPTLVIAVMFFLLMRQLQAGGGKAMSFGKAKARMLSDSQNKVTFADVAGADEGRGRRNHRVPQGSEEVPAARWAHPQGRPHDRSAGHRQDAPRSRDRRRGRRSVLQHLRLGDRKSVV